MLCKIGSYASSVQRMGSCRRNEKSVLRYMIRTRCNNIRGYLILCRDTFFDIRSITIGDIFFVMFYDYIDKNQTISMIHNINYTGGCFFNGGQTKSKTGNPSSP